MKSVMLKVRHTAGHILRRSFALVERFGLSNRFNLVKHIWGRCKGLLWLLLVQEATYMIMPRLLLDYYIEFLVFRENSKLIIRKLFFELVFRRILAWSWLSIRLFSFLELSLLKRRQLSVCPAAQTLIWRLVRCFAHIIDVFEHKLGLFWHSHCTIVHLLQGRNLICRILQIIILKFVWGEWSTLWQWRIT